MTGTACTRTECRRQGQLPRAQPSTTTAQACRKARTAAPCTGPVQQPRARGPVHGARTLGARAQGPYSGPVRWKPRTGPYSGPVRCTAPYRAQNDPFWGPFWAHFGPLEAVSHVCSSYTARMACSRLGPVLAVWALRPPRPRFGALFGALFGPPFWGLFGPNPNLFSKGPRAPLGPKGALFGPHFGVLLRPPSQPASPVQAPYSGPVRCTAPYRAQNGQNRA